MVSIGGEPRLFTQGKSTGESALLYDYFWGVGLKTPWSVVSYICNGLETAETNGCFAVNAPPFQNPATVTSCGIFYFFASVVTHKSYGFSFSCLWLFGETLGEHLFPAVERPNN